MTNRFRAAAAVRHRPPATVPAASPCENLPAMSPLTSPRRKFDWEYGHDVFESNFARPQCLPNWERGVYRIRKISRGLREIEERRGGIARLDYRADHSLSQWRGRRAGLP